MKMQNREVVQPKMMKDLSNFEEGQIIMVSGPIRDRHQPAQ